MDKPRLLTLVIFVLCAICTVPLVVSAQRKVVLSKNGNAIVSISIPSNPSDIQQYAGNELSRYLSKIVGNDVSVNKRESGKSVIRLERTAGRQEDGYSIKIDDNDIIIAGNSDRAILYGVYDFLGRLGCVWLSPNFNYYNDKAEVIPYKPSLAFEAAEDIVEAPVLESRILDVAGARANNIENLSQLVDWMPKLRFNTLRLSMADSEWGKWRTELTPELKKRGIQIEVGGHGYQKFLNHKMEDGKLFEMHPEWFGKDSTCNYSPSTRLVFNTSNKDAVNFFIKNVIDYLKSHPEIDVFDLWPPDIGRWADCPDWIKLGTVEDRHARLSNQVWAAIQREKLDVKLEIIAYSFALNPPQNERVHPDIRVEICPIDQNFEYQINDITSSNNEEYKNAILNWRKNFKGEIGFYSYYRKQAWRSLPNVIPSYMQKDIQWIRDTGMDGISCYAEQGDWYTYELNHFALGNLAWNPEIDLDSLTNIYFSSRYGKHFKKVASVYKSIEEIVPVYGSIAFSTLKSSKEIEKASMVIEGHIREVKKLDNQDAGYRDNFTRLLLMLEYIKLDLEIQHARAAKYPREDILNQIKNLLVFLESNENKGIAILTGRGDFARFTKKYGLTNQSLLD